MTTLYLSGDVNGEMVGTVLQQLETGLERIVLNSDGGQVTDALAIYDALIGRDVTIIATGECMSAAVLVLLAGSRRYATEHCRFLTHPVAFTGEASTADVNEASLLSHVIRDILRKRARATEAQCRELLSGDNYFGAHHAKTIGIIHNIWTGGTMTKPGFSQ